LGHGLLDGITYQQERYSSVIKEALPLLFRHFQEIAEHQDKIPFDPNFDFFYGLERADSLVLVTVRSHGVLVGYSMQVCGPAMHFQKTLWSTNNLIWLDPAFRQGWIGVKLLIEMEKALREKKVQVFEMIPRLHFEKQRGGMQKILDRLGFECVGTVHSKWLGD
jgi:GNAT superfamily N-acetyltransferase